MDWLALKLQIKIGFILMTKCFPLYESDLQTHKYLTIEDIKKNKHYIHLSSKDRLLEFKSTLEEYEDFKKLGFNLVEIDVDNNEKHKYDEGCLNYFKKLINKHYNTNNSKF